MFHGYLELCAYTNRFVFLWYVITPNNGKKHGSGLKKWVKWPFMGIWHYIRACMCVFIYSYIKGRVKMIKLKSI